VEAKVRGDELSCYIDGELIGSFRSPGIAHETKRMIRLLVPKKISVDEIRIWRKSE